MHCLNNWDKGPVSQSPKSGKLLPFTLKIKVSIVLHQSKMIKTSVLLARTCPLIPYISI